MFGTLFGIGVGPGDPELMTFKAARILQRVAAIAYVMDEKGDSLARQIAAAHIPATAIELPLRFSMSPQRERRLESRKEAARLVIERLSVGEDVAFITEGDPLLYSTFQHLLASMPSGVPVEVCPGVSSLTASAAAAVFPLAVEEERMVVAAANSSTPRQLAGWMEQFDVIVLFKVHRYMTELIAALKQTNALSQATLIQRASRNDQSILANLSEWDGTTPPYFSMLLIRGKSQQRASAANGMVYIVGGGPGDPALITVKGLDCLRQADVVLYDRLIAPELLDEAPSSAERINVGKESKLHRRSQSEINALLIEKAREGKTVVRLKGGDPFVFGRGGEECQALAEAGLRYEVVPGISSAIAVPAYAGIPVTYRGVTTAFAVVAGHTVGEDSKIDWRSVSRIGTIVFVMGVERLPEIVSQLVAHERPLDTPAAVIEEGTTQDQRVAIGTLADIVEKSQNARPPAILIVGEVVRLREQLNWFG